MRGMIILCDEAHNLLWDQNNSQEKQSDIRRCRERLYTATESVIVFFTATPVVSGHTAVEDAKSILHLVKESENRHANDEGFISWYMERPKSLFATIKPATKLIRNNKDTYQVAGRMPPVVVNKIPNIWPVPIDTILTRDLWLNYVRVRFGDGKKNIQPPNGASKSGRRTTHYQRPRPSTQRQPIPTTVAKSKSIP